METAGKAITCKASICWAANQPLTVETVIVQPPKAKEVRIKIVSTALCHSDAHLVTGHVTSGFTVKYPIILGHEAAGIVESVGEGVSSVIVGDHVLTMFLPQCNECDFCRGDKTNLCQARGVDIVIMPPDGPRISLADQSQPIYQFCGTSTLSQYTVVSEAQVAKINPNAPLDKVCLLACGITTGYGAAVNLAQVKKGSTVGVWGLGTIGLATAMGAKACGASKIIGVDINPIKFDLGKKFGCTHFLNPNDLEGRSQEEAVKEMTGGLGVDYAFECIGSPSVASGIIDSTAVGWGVTVIQGVFSGEHVLRINPANFSFGKTITGGLFGGYKGRNEVNHLVELYMEGNIMVEEFISGTGTLEQANSAFDSLIAGNVLRTVILPFGDIGA